MIEVEMEELDYERFQQYEAIAKAAMDFVENGAEKYGALEASVLEYHQWEKDQARLEEDRERKSEEHLARMKYVLEHPEEAKPGELMRAFALRDLREWYEGWMFEQLDYAKNGANFHINRIKEQRK